MFQKPQGLIGRMETVKHFELRNDFGCSLSGQRVARRLETSCLHTLKRDPINHTSRHVSPFVDEFCEAWETKYFIQRLSISLKHSLSHLFAIRNLDVLLIFLYLPSRISGWGGPVKQQKPLTGQKRSTFICICVWLFIFSGPLHSCY